MVDAADSKSAAARHVGSSPTSGTSFARQGKIMVTRALPRTVLMFPLLMLAGCGDPSADYPALMPTDRLLAEPAIPGHAGIAATKRRKR